MPLVFVFCTLMMAFFSLWIHKSAWLWGAFTILSYALAIQCDVASPYTLIPLGTLFLLHLMLTSKVSGKERWFFFLCATILSVLLIFHKIPGFHNWKVTERLWVNFDKPFIGLFVLALQLPLLSSRQEWFKALLKGTPLISGGIILLMFLAYYGGSISWDLKWPSHLPIRLASNLFLVSLPEEAFFRGFVQKELHQALGGGWKGGAGSIFIASLLFTFCHISWAGSFALLGFVFLASLLYGLIFQYTQSIECAVICHFLLNLLHMVFFSYHAL